MLLKKRIKNGKKNINLLHIDNDFIQHQQTYYYPCVWWYYSNQTAVSCKL